jgi:hypothetical protein
MRFISFFTVFLLFSCKKEKIFEPTNTNGLQKGILILNEGLFQYNNANLSWVSTTDYSINAEFFEQKSTRKLGDTGNDIKQYGGKIYVVVNVSGTLEVINANSGKSIKQIDFKNGTQNKQPRSIAFCKGKVFISCFDGFVDVVDTTSLQIEKRIKVGLNPDHIISSGTKVYVSNSGGLSFPSMDSTISVINPTNLEEESKIIVGKNPGSLKIIENDLFVIVRGNYTTIPSVLKKVNCTNHTISTFTNVQKPVIIEKMEGSLLVAYQNNSTLTVGELDCNTGNWINSSLISGNHFETLYNIHFEPKNKKIYCFETFDYTITGEILEFDNQGIKKKSFSSGGLIPNSLIYFE